MSRKGPAGSWGIPGGVLRGPGGVWGRLGPSLGRLGPILVRPGAILGVRMAIERLQDRRLGSQQVIFVTLYGALGGVWARGLHFPFGFYRVPGGMIKPAVEMLDGGLFCCGPALSRHAVTASRPRRGKACGGSRCGAAGPAAARPAAARRSLACGGLAGGAPRHTRGVK